MRGLKKIAWEGDKVRRTRTLQLLDQIGPVGRFSENQDMYNNLKIIQK